MLYLPSVHQEPKHLRNEKGANINVGNTPYKLFYRKAVFSQWEANIECWIFPPRLNQMYVSI